MENWKDGILEKWNNGISNLKFKQFQNRDADYYDFLRCF